MPASYFSYVFQGVQNLYMAKSKIGKDLFLNAKLDKKGKREIENLLTTRKLNESAVEKVQKREDLKLRATARRNLS